MDKDLAGVMIMEGTLVHSESFVADNVGGGVVFVMIKKVNGIFEDEHCDRWRRT